MKKVALITGSSSGIGLEMAHFVAQRGYNLLLVSNDEEGLIKAKNILSAYPIETTIYSMDLAQESAANELYHYTKENDFEVEVLINNAGIFFFGEVAETDVQKAQILINLHVATVTQLCIFFAKEMKTRKKGYILNTSSISAYKDFPGIAFYGASKSFIKSFTRSLRTEMRYYGVYVTCLSPGATATNLYDDKGINVELGKKLGIMMSAKSVAKSGVRALFNNRANVVPGVVTKIMLGFSIITPHWVIYQIRKHSKWLK